MLVSDLIKAAFRKCGVYASGETPTVSEYADALLALQMMLRRWASKRILVYASTYTSLTLESGTASYTWGPSGDISGNRPQELISAELTLSDGSTVMLEKITEGRYLGLSDKTEQDQPSYVFYKPTYPNGTLYFYRTPNAALTVSLENLQPFTESSSFASINDTLQLPLNYEEAVLYGLTMRIATEYGKQLTTEMIGLAQGAYNDLVTSNANTTVEPVNLDIPAGRSWTNG